MSDVVRSYSGSASPRKRRQRLRVRSFLPVAILAAVCYLAWTTRDSHPVEDLIPGDQQYWLVVNDIAGKRREIAQSDVLASLSRWFDLRAFTDVLQRDIKAPDWVINNLAGQTCYVTGNDLKTFRDILIVSKMTRVGTLLERFRSFTGVIESDYAGGLELRKLIGQDIYYASRGRVLLVSPNRDTLIHALTLRPGEGANAEVLTGESGSEDVRGSFAFQEDDPLSAYITSFSFALLIDSDKATLGCRIMLRPEVRERLEGVLQGAAPKTLRVPESGMLVLAGNMGKPCKTVLTGVGDAFGLKGLTSAQWEAWRAGGPEASVGVARMMTAVLENAGPSFWLSWVDTDLREIFPVPRLAGVFDVGGTSLANVYEDLTAHLRETLPPMDAPTFDPQTQRLILPLAGGPSLKPTATVTGQRLIVTTSSDLAEAMTAQAPTERTLAQPANLFLRIRPLPCVDALAEAGRLLVELNALKGYNAESFELEVTRWRDKAAAIDEISGLLAVEGGELIGELSLVTGVIDAAHVTTSQ